MSKLRSSLLFTSLALFLTISLSTTLAQKYSFKEGDLSSNMIVTSKYALVGQYQTAVPTLKKLNLQTMKMQTITYPAVNNWVNYYPIVLADLQNGQIAFGEGNHLFILNNQTLELIQTIGIIDRGQPIIQDIKTYYDSQKNESLYLVGRGYKEMIFSQIKRDKNKPLLYESQYRLVGPFSKNQFQITSVNSAITIIQCQVSYISNIHAFINLDYDDKYSLKQRQLVSVSYDETFFVLRNTHNGRYEFYTLEEDLEVTLKQTLQISQNDYQKGFLTNDDKYLFLSISNLQDKHSVVKVDISKQQFTFVTDSDGSSDNMVNFTLLSAQHDRFITLAKRKQDYYLQLRTISTLQIIHEQLLTFDFNPLEFKLIGNPQWGLKFGLVARILQFSLEEKKNANLYIFSVENDKFSVLNFEQFFGDFLNLQATNKYIVSRQNGFRSLKFYHSANLSFAGEHQIFFSEYVIDKNILIQATYNRFIIYDLSQSLQKQGQILSYQPPNLGIFMIFKNRGIIYQSPNADIYRIAKRTIYNFSHPSIQERVPLNSFCNNPKYLISSNSDSQNQCNIVIDFLRVNDQQNWSLQIVKYDECTKQTEKYFFAQLKQFPQFVTYFYQQYRHFISSDQQYLIAVALVLNSELFMIQIRPIVNLSKKLYEFQVKIPRGKYKEYSLDFVKNRMLIVKAVNQVKVYYVDQDSFQNNLQTEQKNNLARETQ